MESAVAVAVSVIGVIVTVVSALGGFAYRTLDNKIAENKKDAMKALEDEERRRKESIVTVTQTVNEHYENLRRDIHEVRQDVKDINRNE